MRKKVPCCEVFGSIVLMIMMLFSMPAGAVITPEPETRLNLTKQFQPNFSNPRQYSRAEMSSLVQEVLPKIQRELGMKFNRNDPHHVLILAEFFALTMKDDLDPYSMPMEESDVRYFSDVEEHKTDELYPMDTSQLIIRFYWEALARLAASYFKLEVVNERRVTNPIMSRGKVSDIATTGMFDKRPGMTVAKAVAQNKDRYDLRRLVSHLKVKGLPAREP